MRVFFVLFVCLLSGIDSCAEESSGDSIKCLVRYKFVCIHAPHMNIITEGESNFVGMLMLSVLLGKICIRTKLVVFQWDENSEEEEK